MTTHAQAKPYLEELEELKAFAEEIPNTRMMAIAKIAAMAAVNMRWEAVMVDRELAEHPWPRVSDFLRDARAQLEAARGMAFIEAPGGTLEPPPSEMEERHHDLFQELWVNFDEADYEDRIDRYLLRLRVNDLAGGFLNGKRCIDFGCGHGNFAHALLREGASHVTGIDYGEESIRYASAARDRLGVGEDALTFRIESVYDVQEPDDSFDFAIQNGVFHHLDDEDTAYREVHRVLKPGGWFWIYTDGEGAVSHDLWDASVHILREIPPSFVVHVLDFLGVETNKRYHLGDGLNAVYRHSTLEALEARLAGYGFGNLKRLVGGFPTDFDHDVIEADPYGVEKFGSGDLRVLVQKR